MKDHEKPLQKEPLSDYTGIDTLATEQLRMVSDTLPSYFQIKYGFNKLYWINHTKSAIKRDLYLLGARIEKLCPDGNFSKASQIKEEFEQRVEESTDEELFGFCQSLAGRLVNGDQEGKGLFYGQMVKTYAGIRREYTQEADAGLILKYKIKPHLAINEGSLTSAVIKSLVTDEEYQILRRAYIVPGDISNIDIDKFQQEVQVKDRKRNIFHQDLLEFAGKNMGKDDLQVLIDILSEERLEKGDLMVKGDNLYYLAGITSIRSGPKMVEFAIYYPNAETDYASEIKRAYEYLEKIRDGEYGYGYLRYESHLGEKRQETDDIEHFQSLFEKYGDYLQWKEGFIKYMHGDYIFSKRIRIDLKKIKDEHSDPGGFTEGIVDNIKNLVGNERTYFLDL